MAGFDFGFEFDEEFHVMKQCLNVVICIYHAYGSRKKSKINKMLEELQVKLHGEREYEEIQIAYVYETASGLDVKKFEALKPETPIYYKDSYDGRADEHNLAHVWLMALALLEQKMQEIEGDEECEDVENRLYLLTDEQFNRVHINRICMKQDGKVVIHPRFAHAHFTPYLIKTEGAGGDLLEEYVKQIDGANIQIYKEE